MKYLLVSLALLGVTAKGMEWRPPVQTQTYSLESDYALAFALLQMDLAGVFGTAANQIAQDETLARRLQQELNGGRNQVPRSTGSSQLSQDEALARRLQQQANRRPNGQRPRTVRPSQISSDEACARRLQQELNQQPGSGRRNRSNGQMSSDEAIARRLQQEFDRQPRQPRQTNFGSSDEEFARRLQQELAGAANNPRPKPAVLTVDCPICLETKTGGQVMHTPCCTQKIGKACWDKWMRSRTNREKKCPLCNTTPRQQ